MNERTDRETQPERRSLSAYVYGDTPDELEMAALDEARSFFGEGPRLEVVHSYEAVQVRPFHRVPAQFAGKKYQAAVLVRVVEP